MLHLANLLHQRYDPPWHTLDGEHPGNAGVAAGTGHGVLCCRGSQKTGILLRSGIRLTSPKHQSTAKDPAAGKAYVVLQLRTKYQGHWLDSVSG